MIEERVSLTKQIQRLSDKTREALKEFKDGYMIFDEGYRFQLYKQVKPKTFFGSNTRRIAYFDMENKAIAVDDKDYYERCKVIGEKLGYKSIIECWED